MHPFPLLLFFLFGILVSLGANWLANKIRNSKRYLVFVYGTFKSGERNHRFLSSCFHNRLVEENATLSGVFLRDMGQWPGMVYSGNGEDVVQGQVWEIDESTKGMLDVLEGVGTPPQQTTAWPGFPVSPYRRQTFVWRDKTIYSYVLDAQTYSLDAYPKIKNGIWKGGPPLMPTHSRS